MAFATTPEVKFSRDIAIKSYKGRVSPIYENILSSIYHERKKYSNNKYGTVL